MEGDGYSYELLLMLIEFKLLYCMVLVLLCIFSCSELMYECLLESEVLECMVDSYVSKLWCKFDEVGLENVLVSVCGVGYCLVVDC